MALHPPRSLLVVVLYFLNSFPSSCSISRAGLCSALMRSCITSPGGIPRHLSSSSWMRFSIGAGDCLFFTAVFPMLYLCSVPMRNEKPKSAGTSGCRIWVMNAFGYADIFNYLECLPSFLRVMKNLGQPYRVKHVACKSGLNFPGDFQEFFNRYSVHGVRRYPSR